MDIRILFILISWIIGILTFLPFGMYILKKRILNKSYNLKFEKKNLFNLIISIIFYVYMMLQTTLFLNNLTNNQFIFYFGFILVNFSFIISNFSRYSLKNNWDFITNPKYNKTIKTNGLYKYERHPIYLGKLMLLIGIILSCNLKLWYLIILYYIFLRYRAKTEEKNLINKNNSYKDYYNKTKSIFL